MSEKSRRRYARFPAFAAACLNELTGIAAQSRADAERLQNLGAPVVAVTGNLKFDITPDPALVALGMGWRTHWGRARPVLLCASTREGEEELLLAAMQRLDVPDLLVLIVPRHPQRFDAVAALIEHAGIAYQRRSAGKPVAATTRIVLGDSMGEMFAYYAASDVAIIGGSLLPYGAQNPIEACAAGCPVIVGSHTYNFAEVVQLAVDAGAAVRVDDAPAAVIAARELLLDPARAQQMGAAGVAFTREHRGAAQRIADLVKF